MDVINLGCDYIKSDQIIYDKLYLDKSKSFDTLLYFD